MDALKKATDKPLIIINESMQFSAGVNLSYTMEFANKGDFKSIEKFVGYFQETNGFFTEYSKTIPSEDMAEVFSHLITDRYQNTNDNILNQKVEFIKDKLSKIDNTFEF